MPCEAAVGTPFMASVPNGTSHADTNLIRLAFGQPPSPEGKAFGVPTRISELTFPIPYSLNSNLSIHPNSGLTAKQIPDPQGRGQ